MIWRVDDARGPRPCDPPPSRWGRTETVRATGWGPARPGDRPAAVPARRRRRPGRVQRGAPPVVADAPPLAWLGASGRCGPLLPTVLPEQRRSPGPGGARSASSRGGSVIPRQPGRDRERHAGPAHPSRSGDPGLGWHRAGVAAVRDPQRRRRRAAWNARPSWAARPDGSSCGRVTGSGCGRRPRSPSGCGATRTRGRLRRLPHPNTVDWALLGHDLDKRRPAGCLAPVRPAAAAGRALYQAFGFNGPGSGQFSDHRAI
ncbi:hypothetical protein HBB16_01660 [Pseudonocardia sp. MCCB 268]|nr:hypothetical protein [Pseudonocardia cytotoxica]